MIRYKIDVIQELKAKGYNTNRIRKEKLISEGSLQQIRTGTAPGPKTLNTLCLLLNKQPGAILEYIRDDLAAETDQE